LEEAEENLQHKASHRHDEEDEIDGGGPKANEQVDREADGEKTDEDLETREIEVDLLHHSLVEPLLEEGDKIEDEIDGTERQQNEVDNEERQILVPVNVIGIVANEEELNEDLVSLKGLIDVRADLIDDAKGVFEQFLHGFFRFLLMGGNNLYLTFEIGRKPISLLRTDLLSSGSLFPQFVAEPLLIRDVHPQIKRPRPRLLANDVTTVLNPKIGNFAPLFSGGAAA